MQQPMSMIPGTQPSMPTRTQQRTSAPSSSGTGWRSRLVSLLLLTVVVALVGGSLFWLQWSSQRGITLGYPIPTVHITSTVPSSVAPRMSIQFSADGSGREISYFWDFGDQSTDTGAVVNHAYQTNGTFTVTVTITDALDHTSSASTTVTVVPPPPTASFTFNEGMYFNGYEASMNFDASASTGGTGTTIAQYVWNFGDNSAPETDTSPTTSHYYYSATTYTVTLTVYDATGQASAPVILQVPVQ